MNFNSRYPIAIDLSDGAELGALQMAEDRGAPLIRAMLRRETAATEGGPPEEDVQSFLRDVLRHPAFQGKSVALLPPPGAVRCYPLRVEVGKEETFEAALIRLAQGVLDIPIAEMLLDYASVQEEEPSDQHRYQVFLVAIRKETVAHYLDLVRKAGGALEVVEFAASALLRLHALAAAKRNPVLLCKIGRAETVLAVASRNAILAHRGAPWGTSRLIRNLVDNLNLGGGARDADFLLRKHGLLQAVRSDTPAPMPEAGDDISQTVAQLLAPQVEELLHECHNLMAYVRSGTPTVVFDGLFVYGHGTRVAGLTPYLARELNVEAHTMNPLEKLGALNLQTVSGLGDGSNLALALGLAMRRIRWL